MPDFVKVNYHQTGRSATANESGMREIVSALQKGDNRAEYGQRVIEKLSKELTSRYGRGFSSTNLRYFRNFYSVYSERMPLIRHIGCGEFSNAEKPHTQSGVLQEMSFAIEIREKDLGFSPERGWSHYRALMNVENRNETIAKYSVLKESKQIFASKYILQLPTEEELRLEIERERRQIEENHEE